MKAAVRAAVAVVAAAAAGAPAGEPWHARLVLPGGGAWRARLRVDVRNDQASAVAGEPVALRVGGKGGEVDLAGRAARGVRVCDANGTEMLYALTSPAGEAVTSGPIPAGSTLTIPVECAAKATARYYVYFDNPSAWAVPDFLSATAGVRNGGMERGTGGAPSGWRHDVPDERHRTFWVAEDPHAGRRCLKTVVADGAEPTWIATRQGGIRVTAGAKYVLTAWVRARSVRGLAGWYVHVGSAAKPMMISPMLSGGAGTYGWKLVRAKFTAPPEANVASLGTVLRGTGTAWFDDVQLTCLAPAKLTATAAPPERLDLKEIGADAPWLSAKRAGGTPPDWRAAIRATNFAGRDLPKALLCVETATLRLGRAGAEAPAQLLAGDGRNVLPSLRVGTHVLLVADVPARTARTFHVYGRGGAAPPGRQLQTYAKLLTSPRNHVRNASFEAGEKLPEHWPGGAEGARPPGTRLGLDRPGRFGGRCVRLHVPQTSQPAWTGWRQDVPVRPGCTVLYAAWLKCRDIRGGGVQLHAHYRNAAGQLCREKQFAGVGPALTGTHDWTLLAGTFTMPRDVATFQLHLTMNATGTVWHDGVLLAEVLPAAAGPPERREAEHDGPVAVWAVNPVVKVFRQDAPPGQVPPARISAARNEAEPLQLAVRAAKATGKVRVKVDPPVAPGGAKLADWTVGVVGYVPIDHPTSYYRSTSPSWHRKFPTAAGRSDGWAGLWPDPILPKDTFDLPARQTQPVWLTVKVPKDAPPGEYRGAVRLMSGGRCLRRVPVGVRVWGFALPDEAHVAAVYDVRMHSPLWRRPGRTRRQQVRRMWRFLAERRLCPDRIQPDPILRYRDGKVHADFAEYNEAATYYLDELKLPHTYTPRCFYLFGWGHPPKVCFGERPYEGEVPYEGADRAKLRPAFRRAYQACLKAYWQHMKAKGWHEKVLLYISDEPHDRHPEIRAQMKALCAMIHEVDPAIPIYSSTWHHQPAWDGSLDVWGIGHYGVVPTAKMRQLREAGKRLWFTTDGHMCTDTPYCAIERLLPHYCFACGAAAYEFWGADWLTYDPYEFGWHRYIHQSDRPGSSYYVRYPNGDGYLAYPGAPIGHDGIISSIRLEQAREGVEDCEYLHLLRRLVSKAPEGKAKHAGRAALAEAQKLVTIPNAGGRYSTKILPDPDALLRARRAAAEAIERLRR